MATISKDRDHVVLLNVFTVEPENADTLLHMLAEITESTMKAQPGFISANFHRSLDGRKVMNYAQWESVQAFEAMRNDPEAGSDMKHCADLAIDFEPTLYRLEHAS